MDGLLAGGNLDLIFGSLSGMVSVVAVAAGLRLMFAGRSEVVERLERVGRQDLEIFGQGGTPVAEPHEEKSSQFLGKLLSPLAKLARPAAGEELSRARLDLIRAGYRGEFALEIFLGLKLVLAAIVPMIFLQVNSMRETPLAFPIDVVMAVWLCGLSFWVPNLIMRSKIKERQTELERALPDAMDLLVTCVEAGLGLDSALARVAEEMQLSSPQLSDQLTQTFLEIQAGIQRADAFRRLAERTGVEDLRQLSAMLIQTDMFGTSVARALRVHSDSMRVKRMQRAEEKAAMVSVKMTIPLVLCILPSLIAVVMGPAIVMIMKSFGSSGI